VSMPEKIAVEFNSSPGLTYSLDVEERVFADRTCGQWESGWRCYSFITEYFISDSGVVWRQPENVECGIAPEIKAAADRMDAMVEKLAQESDQ
jgi:hypothetical protein